MITKTISGKLTYLTDDIGEEGREDFQITCLRDGRRILQAQSVMTNDDLIRSSYLMVSPHWAPITAHIHLIKGDYEGSGTYHFTEDHVNFIAENSLEGRVDTQALLSMPVTTFGGHALQNDAWMYGAFDCFRGEKSNTHLPNTVITSHASNGGDGPALTFTDQHHRYLGDEDITTQAGTFATRKYEFLFEDRPPIQYWVTGDDYIIVRCRWDLLNQTYDLIACHSAVPR